MDRMTHRMDHTVPTKFAHDFIFHMNRAQFRGYQALLDRLADYEDTGLTPEEITTMAAKLRQIEEGKA